MDEIKRKLMELFENDEQLFNDTIEELDGYNGYLGDDRYYLMDDITEFYHGAKPLELLRLAFYGWDENNYTIDEHGRKQYCEFNPNRDYFRYNGYGNLVSSDYKDYSDHLDEYFIDSLIENACSLWLDDEIEKILEEGESE